jgi:hypothetical protein
MSAVFAAPRWLRDLGIASWLLVGVAALLVGLTWVAGMTSTISCRSSSADHRDGRSPGVSWMNGTAFPCARRARRPPVRDRDRRVIVLLVVGGVRGQSDTIAARRALRRTSSSNG